jgi:hypothetical protein
VGSRSGADLIHFPGAYTLQAVSFREEIPRPGGNDEFPAVAAEPAEGGHPYGGFFSAWRHNPRHVWWWCAGAANDGDSQCPVRECTPSAVDGGEPGLTRRRRRVRDDEGNRGGAADGHAFAAAGDLDARNFRVWWQRPVHDERYGHPGGTARLAFFDVGCGVTQASVRVRLRHGNGRRDIVIQVVRVGASARLGLPDPEPDRGAACPPGFITGFGAWYEPCHCPPRPAWVGDPCRGAEWRPAG